MPAHVLPPDCLTDDDFAEVGAMAGLLADSDADLGDERQTLFALSRGGFRARDVNRFHDLSVAEAKARRSKSSCLGAE